MRLLLFLMAPPESEGGRRAFRALREAAFPVRLLTLALAVLACSALAVLPHAVSAQTLTINLSTPQIQTPSISVPEIEVPGVSFFQTQGSTASLPQIQFPSLSFFPVQTTASALASTASTSQATIPTVDQTAVIDGSSYGALNAVTYFKTAGGLQVVLAPAALTGSGPLAKHTEGLSLEIPDALIRDLFF